VITLERVDDLRALCERARHEGKMVGLVPTMGYFHEGHRSLMRAARAAHDLVVVTIFVNPLQFGAHEDLDGYPRDLAGDTTAATAEGVDVLFAPSRAEMYPEPTRTTVHVDGLSAGLCGGTRPSHFDGVTTVVAKLFSIVGPCTAYFGRKDAQQLAVVRRLVRDLHLGVEIVAGPTVREEDGLALSSRNARLSPEERRAAAVLQQALRRGEAAAFDRTGGDGPGAPAEAVRRALREALAAEPLARVDYAEVVDAESFQPVAGRLAGEVILPIAVWIGDTRLIDNLRLRIDDRPA
jgi:pantoate--beta-alanine ligase